MKKLTNKQRCGKCIHKKVCEYQSYFINTEGIDRCNNYSPKANKGNRKQSEGEWVFEAHYFYDDYGDLCIYATAKCSECKKAYTNPHSTVASMRVSRPENLSEYDDWEVDVEPFLTEILEMARARKDLSKFCPNCGAHMRGGKNE